MSQLAIVGGPRALNLAEPCEPVLDGNVVAALHAAVERARDDWSYLSGVSGLGPIETLEREMSRRIGARYALALSSGTAALTMALIGCGVNPGDEVIVPAYTWGQSVGPVLHVGAMPVFADIDRDGCTLDSFSVERSISGRTKAILAVHLFGHPADVRALRELADAAGIALIEDCAQAFGATVGGQPVGSFGRASAFSFGRRKRPTGGEGGVLLTDSRLVFQRAVAQSQHPVRQFRELSRRLGSDASEFGFNYRMHPFAAVAAGAGLETAERALAGQRAFWGRFGAALSTCPGIRAPQSDGESESAWFHYCPTVVPGELGLPDDSRDLIVSALAAEGVPVDIDPIRVPLHHRAWPPASPRPASTHALEASEDRCYRTGMSVAPWLAALEEPDTVAMVADAVRKVMDGAGALLRWASETGGTRPGRIDQLTPSPGAPCG